MSRKNMAWVEYVLRDIADSLRGEHLEGVADELLSFVRSHRAELHGSGLNTSGARKDQLKH